MFTTAQNRFAFQKTSAQLVFKGVAKQHNFSQEDSVSFKKIPKLPREIAELPELVLKESNLAKKIPESWLRSGFLRTLANLGANNQPLLDTLCVLGLTTTLRPLAILATPGAEKENREYSAAQSICSGIVSFIFGFLIYHRCKGALKKAAEKAATDPKINFPVEDSSQFSAYSTVLTNSVKTVCALLEGAVLFALVPIIMKKLFPKRNKEMDLAPVYAAKLSEDQQRVYEKLMDHSISSSSNTESIDLSESQRSNKVL